MEEHLVEYVLETLDPLTHQRVEVYLRTHPEAQEKLDLLRAALEPLAFDQDADDLAPLVLDRGGAVVDGPLRAIPGDQDRVVGHAHREAPAADLGRLGAAFDRGASGAGSRGGGDGYRKPPPW